MDTWQTVLIRELCSQQPQNTTHITLYCSFAQDVWTKNLNGWAWLTEAPVCKCKIRPSQLVVVDSNVDSKGKKKGACGSIISSNPGGTYGMNQTIECFKNQIAQPDRIYYLIWENISQRKLALGG